MNPRLFIETDIYSDVDDAGAIALATVLQAQGRCSLIGIGVNTPSRWGAPAAGLLNALGGSNAPVGHYHVQDDSLFVRDYARHLVTTYPELAPKPGPEPCPDAVSLWRRQLQAAPDGSVVPVSIGFPTNLARLLASKPDDHSPLSGQELVAAKVGHTVVMGGQFPTGREFNFHTHPEATAAFLSDWPGSIDFVGYEIGKTVWTGSHLPETLGAKHPLAAAYAAHWGAGNGRSSWDLIAVLVAVCDPSQWYDRSEPGTVTIEADGTNGWHPGPPGRHHYFIPRVDDAEIADLLDDYLAQYAPEFRQ